MIRRRFMFLLGLLMVTGCARRADHSAVSFESDVEHRTVVAIDLSGSFVHLMAEEGYAYSFLMNLLDRHGQDRANDQIVIAQLSGTDRPLLFEGTPSQLQEAFPTAATFQQFLISKSNPGGSRIRDGIAEVLEYLLMDPRVRDKQVKTCCFVLSDLVDNWPDPNGKTEQRLNRALSSYKACNGLMAFYFVDEHFGMPEWMNRLQTVGLQSHMQAGINRFPILPTFD